MRFWNRALWGLNGLIAAAFVLRILATIALVSGPGRLEDFEPDPPAPGRSPNPTVRALREVWIERDPELVHPVPSATLLGTMPATDPNTGWAFLRYDRNRSEHGVQEGRPLPGGYRGWILVEVRRTSAVITDGVQRRVLGIPRHE